MFFPLLILAEPKEVFDRVATRAPWFGPLISCTAGYFVITWLGGCWADIREGLRWWSLLGPAIGSILFVGTACLGSTAMLYISCLVFQRKQSNRLAYRKLFSLNAHCVLILVLGELINFLLVRANLMQAFNVPFPNRFPLGLDLLILGAKEPNIYLAVILHSTSVFIIWYFVVLARGLDYLSGSGPMRSAATAAILWIAGVGVVIGLIYSAGGGTMFRITM
jgi:hypothetical protein